MHPLLIQVYKDYMNVRQQALVGLVGTGAVSLCREALREVYRALKQQGLLQQP